MTSKEHHIFHSGPRTTDEHIKNALQPRKVNYQSEGKILEVQFYRFQHYVGRVTFGNCHQRDEPIDVDFYWTEEFPHEDRDKLTEEAFAFGSAAIQKYLTGWAEVALDRLPAWQRPCQVVAAWSKESAGEIMEQWKSDNDSRLLYRYPKDDPESGRRMELTPAMANNMMTVLDEVKA
jgi:hypothetical protein